MKKELNYYQNIYRTKEGIVMVSEKVWSSIDEAKSAIEKSLKNGNQYVATIKLNTENILK